MNQKITSFWLLAVLGFALSLCATEKTSAAPGLNPNDEYIIISGGPALLGWEKFRRTDHRHDKWWGNFIRSARIRIQRLQKATNGGINITWMVYRPGYESREREDGTSLISNIESVRDTYKINLVWFDDGDDVINYVNSGRNRMKTKVSGFEYFGHSNKFCFVFDYSNGLLGASNAFLHQADLKRFKRSSFAKGAYCKSWGCHSAESFCKEFRRTTGKKMIGAIGKTDYSNISRGTNGTLPTVSPGGRWSR